MAMSIASAADAGVHHLTLVARPELIERCRVERWGFTSVPVDERASTSRRGIRGELTKVIQSSRVRHALNLPDPTNPVSLAKRVGAQVILPVMRPQRLRSVAGVGWIPDLQHRHLPDLFAQSERNLRDRLYRRLAELCRLILLSSEAAKSDFLDFAPDLAEKARVASFPSSFAFTGDLDGTSDVREIYGLPGRFALVVNQFWRHKNHGLVIEAFARLRASGVDIPLVLIGRPADYRDRSNEVVSQLLQKIAVSRLRDRVWMLGEVPRIHLLALMRTSTLIIQPSLFEGWSTSVQDASALGRPLVCANIPVLREQAASARGFFDPHDPDVLASLLGEVWSSLEPGPDKAAEAAALENEKSFARAYGRRLLDICDEASSS